MSNSGQIAIQRRSRNSSAIAAFGVSHESDPEKTCFREVRAGGSACVFTIGYERRDITDLMHWLQEAGVEILVDVRERPISRKPDFRKNVLAGACEDAGLEYQSWTSLGSTSHQREQLRETGDFSHFRHRFRDFARRSRSDVLDSLAELARKHPIALMCYERCHEECHRSIVADLLADRVDATIIAIQ